MAEVKIFSSEPTSLRSYFSELRKYKGLIWVFAVQELKSMYAQTYFGVLWTIMRPLATLSIFTVIFKLFLKVPSQSPYYLFAFSGMIAWNLFSNISLNTSNAIQQKQAMIRKMYFPKIIIACVEGLVSLAILFIMMMFERLPVTTHLLLLPVFICFNIICGLAIGIWMNALNIHFRDLNQIIPTIVGIGIWLTPVFYPTTVVPPKYNFLIYMNPMAGVIKGYRFSLLGEPFPELNYWYAMLAALTILLVGIGYFIYVEDTMVDYI